MIDESARPCERCGETAAVAVGLLAPDMALSDHALCASCWNLLVAGMARHRPWVRGADPQTLVIQAALAYSWMDEAATLPA